jgi:hypothetical protein
MRLGWAALPAVVGLFTGGCYRKPTIEDLLKMVASGRVESRKAVAELAAMGPEARAPIVKALMGPDLSMRMAAWAVLRQRGTVLSPAEACELESAHSYAGDQLTLLVLTEQMRQDPQAARAAFWRCAGVTMPDRKWLTMFALKDQKWTEGAVRSGRMAPGCVQMVREAWAQDQARKTEQARLLKEWRAKHRGAADPEYIGRPTSVELSKR